MISFILSTGRTGTVFIHNVLSHLPKIHSRHERHARLLRIPQHMRIKGISAPFLDDLEKKLYIKPLSKVPKKSLHFEINPSIKGYVKNILSFFPEANYIHIVRDPRTLAASGVNWSSSRPLNAFFKLYTPYWTTRPDQFSLGKDKQTRLFEIAVQNWIQTNHIYASIKESSSNYYLFKFEEIIKDPFHFIEELLQIADYQPTLEDKMQIQRAISTSDKNESPKMFSSWKKWEDKYVLYMQDKCGQLMEQFGYGQEPAWLDRVNKARRIAG